MAFDQPTRKRLLDFVSDARTLLTEEFTRQMQHEYGLNPTTGEVADLNNLTQLDDGRRQSARMLRETMEHYLATNPGSDRRATIERIVREQAFTVLNRLCALRMAEARGLLIESVGQGYQSKGFQLYARLAGTALGETGDAYRCYLFSLFDEFAVDLAVLFDRFSPSGRLFPREAALLPLLEQINHPDIDALWGEDETIGWVYQYFNSKEERKKMRDESAAPRNSRELAVRNQFFTPRYVVEFLTDNTLGRIWYEMTQGQTSLKDSCRYMVRRPNEIFLRQGEQPPVQNGAVDGLSQEELLKQPLYIPFRLLKDPREIKMLDPACGSMHFGLYAFDLFERIYAEAWELEDEEKCTQFNRSEGLLPLRETYASSYADFLRDVPRLIIEHNIHGIEIDPRAVQIAGLSLWLRAQKSWQTQGVKSQARPQIRRSNIACAEPMPGEAAFLEEFIAQHLSGDPERQFLAGLVRKVFDSMTLAGEAGSLLKIEEEIADEVAKAKRQWLDRPAPKQRFLFAAAPKLEQKELDLTRGITDESFWGEAEGRIYDALRSYSEQAENGGGFQRRLFADDAARGFAFIDLCRKRYDVVLMNPPFGLGTTAHFVALKPDYPDGYVDLCASFVLRGRSLCDGRLGAITSRAFLIAKKLERFRANTILPSLSVLLDLGYPVMDGAMVQSAAYVLDVSRNGARHFFDAIDQKELPNKADGLDAICAMRIECHRRHYVARSQMFALPRCKVLYNLPNVAISLFTSARKLGSSVLLAKLGMKSFRDFRFLRLRSEVDPRQIGESRLWEPLSKGGPLAFFYSDLPLLIKWNQTGREIAEVNRLVNGQTAQARQASIYYRRPGGTYSRRCKDFGVRVLPAGCIIGEKGPAILPVESAHPLFIIGLLNSAIVNALVNLQANAKQYDSGIVERLPAVDFSAEQVDHIRAIALAVTQSLREAASFIEGDSLFAVHPTASSIAAIRNEIVQTKDSGQASVAGARHAINEVVDIAYKIDSASLADAIQGLGADDSDDDPVDADDSDDDVGEMDSQINNEGVVAALLSYILGCDFGRWDLRFTTGEQIAPKPPDPFAPLPVCPPGMLQNAQGLPLTQEDQARLQAAGSWQYPIDIPWNGLLVDDPGHPLDIEARVQQVLKIIWPDRCEAIEHEACEMLGVKTLREYFRKPALFFADHLKRYSKSRRQAPIYWPLATTSGSYTLWVYYHRFTDQTLYTAVNDFVEPKLKQVATEAARLRPKTGRTSADEKELEQLTDLEQELKEFRDELLRLAQFWKPNLNDGVQITAAPLWKLFRLSAWQKKLKETWQKLEAGEYDWAHLAHSIWPDRVAEKCKTDKSLAIAHNLEHLYVELPKPAKKRATRKKKVEAEIEDEEFGD